LIVVDTGPLVALVNENDSHHDVCREWFADPHLDELVIPAPVIAEACYLIGQAMGADVESVFLEDLADGTYGRIVGITPEDLRRMSVLVKQYADMPLGGTDACVIAVAERMRTAQVATVDRKHFRVVRPSHVVAFDLLPTKL
jgi:predicted nucleic acid-binding protein